MKIYLTKIIRHVFKKTEFSELKILDNWNENFLPSVNDIIVIDDNSYVIRQRTFYSSDIVKIYIEKIS